MAETYEVIITPRAENSLQKIIHYLVKNASVKTARKVRKGILESINKLQENPESNGIVREISDDKLVFRRALKWSYRIIYLIEESEKIVFVVEINHVKENPKKLKDLIK